MKIDTEAAIRGYVDRARKVGPGDDEFHGLIELGGAGVPLLIEEIRKSENTSIRAFLIHVLWQYRPREEATFELLAQMLFDSEADVWKEALDGFVAIGGPRAVDWLKLSRTRMAHDDYDRWQDRLEWIDEALERLSTQ